MLTIDGTNFGKVSSRISVKVGSTSCTGVSVVTNHARITCAVQQGVGVDHNVVVTADGLSGTLSNAFDYNAPSGLDMQYAYYRTLDPDGGQTVTLNGDNFGHADYGPAVSVCGVSCTTSHVSDTRVTFTTPDLTSGCADTTPTISITVSSQSASLADMYRWAEVSQVNGGGGTTRNADEDGKVWVDEYSASSTTQTVSFDIVGRRASATYKCIFEYTQGTSPTSAPGGTETVTASISSDTATCSVPSWDSHCGCPCDETINVQLYEVPNSVATWNVWIGAASNNFLIKDSWML